MDPTGLDQRLIAQWQAAAADLGIRVTAPYELRDSAGEVFAREAFIYDFGSPAGAVVVSRRTERRVRSRLRSLSPDLWFSGGEKLRSAKYVRKHFIAQLVDWGWFGADGQVPDWYQANKSHPG